MIPTPTASQEGLRRSIAEIGGVLLTLDQPLLHEGKSQNGLFAAASAEGILESLLSSRFAQGLLVRALARAAIGSDTVVEPLGGVFVVPIKVQRTPNVMRTVVVTLLSEAIEGEALQVLAQHAQMDATLVRRVLRANRPWDRQSSPRFLQCVHALARAEVDRVAGVEAGTQLGAAWEELHLLHTLSSRMAVGESPRAFAQSTLAELRQTLGCRWAALRVDGDAASLLDVEVGTVLFDSAITADRSTARLDDARLAEHVLAELGEIGRATVIGTDLVVAPVACEHAPFGLLAAGSRVGGDGAMSNCERTLVETAASHLSVFLDNARLYSDLDRMFIGALSAIVTAIDAKDPYTHGHSRRVALLSWQIATAAGLPEREARDIYIAGLVHDVGKIGISESVLRKPGKLNDEEFAQIKQHPEIGWRILRGIPRFERVLDGVRFHHERFDGRGYPHGLFGHAIPLAARILSIADTFDAMSSNRTYREARSRPEVLAELRRLAGVQLDPDLLSHFFDIDLAPYDVLLVDGADSADTTELPMLRPIPMKQRAVLPAPQNLRFPSQLKPPEAA
jgi:HD-GYP domain-containing protein (c-di-GMP phosphodiesterase class II)